MSTTEITQGKTSLMYLYPKQNAIVAVQMDCVSGDLSDKNQSRFSDNMGEWIFTTTCIQIEQFQQHRNSL